MMKSPFESSSGEKLETVGRTSPELPRQIARGRSRHRGRAGDCGNCSGGEEEVSWLCR